MSPAQFSLEVDVGGEASFREAVGSIVEDFVEDPQPEVAHPDLVQIGIDEAPFERGRRPVLLNGVPFAPGVPAGLADAAQYPLDSGPGQRLG